QQVTKDQQTWRAEYKGSDTPAAALAAPKAPPAAAAAKPAANKPQGTPKLEFVQAGNKWVVEHQGKDAGVVTVEVTDTKHSVYVYGCVDATLDIKGKCKSVCIDGCRKSQVFVDECISSVEAVNCQRIKVQVRVAVPSVAIDKTDGFQCYLSATALETTFTTSKSSEMNVSFPRPGGDDDELMELPIPEQFVHSLTNLAPGGAAPMVTSSVSDLYTH
ncbi:adenylate cyclase associated C terminal-domain-containing protein, partial [Tribonema minus]